ncbi:MAG: type II/IV secretion system protein [Clostridia bacterium]|nr:type II/IV secretion system protein [Clostridia bacterium]
MSVDYNNQEYYSRLGILPEVDIDMFETDKGLLARFPLELLRKHKIVPIKVAGDTISFALSNSLDTRTVSVISHLTQGKYELARASEEKIKHYIDSFYSESSTASALKEISGMSSADAGILADEMLTESAEISSNPAVKLVDSILREAIIQRASDVHIEPFERIVKVRFRIDGDLRSRAEFPRDAYPAVSTRIKIMSGLNIAQRRASQDGRINMSVSGIEYDLRISTLPTVFGEKFAIRILDKSSFSLSRSDVGFEGEENDVINKMLSHPHGIILLTGPTGCGKSTTLYSFLRELNDPSVNIVTVEDPVEYTMEGVNQTQVNQKAGLTFATALRAILRQDPDIVMLGEIRDEETAAIAVRAAITGHLVFSTLHTNDAPGAIIRLQDMGVEDYLLSDALVGVIAQRLVKKLCPACKEARDMTDADMRLLGTPTPQKIYSPKGCRYCDFTGYKGRCAVHEIMYVGESMKSAILTDKSIDVLKEKAISCGMTPLEDACKRLVLNGTTSVEELINLGTN